MHNEKQDQDGPVVHEQITNEDFQNLVDFFDLLIKVDRQVRKKLNKDKGTSKEIIIYKD